MSAVAFALRLALVSLAICACDSSGEKPAVPPSLFAEQDPYVQGRVLEGMEGVSGAIVQLAPRPFAGDERDAGDLGIVATADLDGKYRIPHGPFLYDLSVRKDREVVVFRNAGARRFEPPFASEAPMRGFTARVEAT